MSRIENLLLLCFKTPINKDFPYGVTYFVMYFYQGSQLQQVEPWAG